LTRQAWHSKNVRCPQSRLIHTGADALRYFSELKKPLVLKPLTGSGSELTFSCADEYELVKAFGILKDGLEQRKQSRMYFPPAEDAGGEEPRPSMAAEEFISGREYSCDFLIDGPELRLIRVAKKMPGHGLPFGTTLAYTVPAQLPGWLDRNTLRNRLRGAARALGITRAICMVDFIVTRDDVVFLEMTPRLGGDCLPRLVWHGCGLDVLGLALDFAEGGTPAIPPAWQWRHVAGLKLFATIPGTFQSMCTDRLTADSRVLELGIRWVPGHQVVLPPQDYDSWLLGHVIFKPDANIELERQCDDLRGKLIVQMETTNVQDLSGGHGAGRQITGTADAAT
jgi:biotin carboxylase